MRLSRLRFKNLNSLVGEWVIDFQHPDIAGDGIFLVTGPTGAGKSTILDAISLALYARTPRLGPVNQSANEILSRHQTECFAEVEFHTPQGGYRCVWSQTRAHAKKRSDGRLQEPKHALHRLEDGEILSNKLRQTAELVERVTGLDYKRFTHSILLAQGDFAAFLRADEDARAPLLEQITGTGVYAELSRAAHQRLAAERKIRDRIAAELDGTQVLDEAERQTLNAERDVLARREQDIEKEAAQTDQALRLHQEHAKLRAENEDIESALRARELREAEFAPRRRALAEDARARGLEADYASVAALRAECDGPRRQADENRTLLPARQAEADEAAKKTADADKAVAEAERALAEALPALRLARDLDLRLAEKKIPLAAARRQLAQAAEARDAARAQGLAAAEEHRALQTESDRLDRELERDAADAGLVEDLAALRERAAAAAGIDAERAAKDAEAETAREDLRRAVDRERGQAEAGRTLRRKLDAVRAGLDADRARLDRALEGRAAAHWRERQKRLAAEALPLDRADDALRARALAREALVRLADEGRRAADEAEKIRQRQNEVGRRAADREKQRDLLRDKLALLQRVARLEAQRAELRDGRPCPLCGALEHPYADGALPASDAEAARAELAAAENELNELRQAQAQDAAASAALERDRVHLEAEAARQAALEKEAAVRLAEAIAEIPADPDADAPASGGQVAADPVFDAARFDDPDLDDPALADRLDARRGQNREASRRADEAVGAAEEGEAALAAGAARVNELEQGQIRAEAAESAAVRERDLAAVRVEALAREAVELRHRADEAFAALCARLARHGPAPSGPQALDAILQNLEGRRDRWLARRRAREDAGRRALEAASRRAVCDERLRRENEAASNAGQVHESLAREADELLGQRRALLGDRDPEAEENRLAETARQAALARDRARGALHDARAIRERVLLRLADAEASLAERAQKLAAREEEFQNRLTAEGFANEAQRQAALLPTEKRAQDENLARELEAEAARLDERRRECARRLEAVEAARLGIGAEEALKEAAEKLRAERAAAARAIGAIDARLSADAQARQRLGERERQLEAQRSECARWEAVDALIGSADGGVYRNFAQALTFDRVIEHANRQLAKMSDRYRLVQSSDKRLELDVIDHYQAGAARPARTLSGGEGFLVSLALALGLSRMASRRVRVDSLFLDEGFGSLDAESLEQALDTLAGLRADGKLIGLISHVPALRERVAARIQVIPGPNGQSRLSGPGCRAVASK